MPQDGFTSLRIKLLVNFTFHSLLFNKPINGLIGRCKYFIESWHPTTDFLLILIA